MNIVLEQMIPLPLLEQQGSDGGLWQTGTCRFQPGEEYLVEAPSGRGKTSLLSVIYGMRNDYRGKVLLDDEDISGFSQRRWSEIRRSRLSFIFQGLELFDELTALDNILLKNAITGEKTEVEILDMAENLGIAPFLHRKAGILSFGQQQRVAIVRSLCQPFEYLLADECFSHIDRENTAIAFNLIREECRNRGAGLILTSLHATGEVSAGERIVL